MNKICLVALLIFVQQSLAFDGFTYSKCYHMNLWSNNMLSDNIESCFNIPDSYDCDVVIDLDVENSVVLKTVYFCKWENEQFSDDQTKVIFDSLKPFIRSFEKHNNCILWVRNVSKPDTPHLAKNRYSHISNFQLTFVDKKSPDRENPEKKYFFDVDIFNSNSKTLTISILSILPIEMKGFPTMKE